MTRPGTAATLAMVMLVGLLWGLNWPTVKYLLTALPPLTLRAVSFTAAAAALLAITRGMGQPLTPTRDELPALLLTGLFVLFGFNLLTVLGQLFTPASNAAIIAYTMPALTALLAVLFLGEVLDRRLIAAIVLSLAGLAVLASTDLALLLAEPLGPLLMLGAALSWSIGNVLMQSRSWSLPPLARVAWFFVLSTLLIWPLALIFERPAAVPWPGPFILALWVFHVCGPMVACYVLWTVILGRLPATVAAISILIAPVVGVLASILLLGEPLTWQKMLALALIVISIALTVLRRRKPQPAA